MGKMNVLLVTVVIAMCFTVFGASASHGHHHERGKGKGEGKRREHVFLLRHSTQVVKTDAGEMRVVMGLGGRGVDRSLHIGFLTMEPNSLLIPHYLDSNLVLFIRRGEAKVGLIYKDELVEEKLKEGDVYRIGAGSAFYLVNTADGQRLHAISSIDRSESLGSLTVQPFFIGGGTNPTSVLAGFDQQTLANAFNVSTGELREMMTRQQSGPIVSLSDSHRPTMWTQFLDLEGHQKLTHLKKLVKSEGEEATEEKQQSSWSWRKLLDSLFGKQMQTQGNSRSPGSYNLYDRQPDFKNSYGWSIAVEESDYSTLSQSGVSVYLVNLTAGSMMAPHVNPTATEYGTVLSGRGRIEIVYPNGTSAMNAEVKEGDVFWVPRYFPFCQIASQDGPLEFFGFTTSAKKNHPQFLVGRNSVLQTLRSRESAAAFDLSREKLKQILNAQRESVILPASASPSDHQATSEKKESNGIPKVLGSLGRGMIMDFN